jgi:hypothetical protein
MIHNEYIEMIPVYLYDELDLDKKKLFEEHIKSCKDCMLELESYKNLFAEISKDAHSTVDPKLLMEARLELRGLLRAQRNKVSISSKFVESLTSLISRPVGLAFSGFSVLLVGVLIGYLVFQTPVVENVKTDSSQSDQIKIQNINFIDPDPSDGQVEFTFDAIKSGHIKGNINDTELQKMLTYAVLNEQNPGTRLNSINVINANQTQSLDNEIKTTLISVVKFDDNPGVKRVALKSLKEIPIDNDIKSALIYILLNDTSSGLRIEAINTLVEAAKKGFSFSQNDLSILREKIQVDNNNYIRFQAKNIIKEY